MLKLVLFDFFVVFKIDHITRNIKNFVILANKYVLFFK